MKNQLHAGGDVGEQAHGQLDTVEQDGVPGSMGGPLLCGYGPGHEHDSEVGED